MSETTEIKPGQTLWYVPRHGEPREVTVEKIGRRWATLVDVGGWRPGRMDIKTMWLDDGAGYSSPGRCYLSREAHETAQRISKLWNALARRVSPAGIQSGVTEAAILEAAALLRIDLPVSEIT
jgi:hypothetical protein